MPLTDSTSMGSNNSNAAPTIVRTVAALRAAVGEYRRTGQRIALVPTMGALHGGHMALVDAARAAGARIVVSIFINPAQFAPSEDLASYPRHEAEDLAKLAVAGVDLVFMPEAGEVYGEGFTTSIIVAGPGKGLESAQRPHFFAGVATVVSKLLLQCLPDVAIFGEKDYQQLQVVRRMVRDLDIPCDIQAIATVREADGLACSSRNAYLSPAERQIATSIYKNLQATAMRLQTGGDIITEIEYCMARLRQAGFDQIDYLALCDGASLEPLSALCDGARLLVAVQLGKTRLIDNIAV
jgi:pantoate--beta-alanine ligase